MCKHNTLSVDGKRQKREGGVSNFAKIIGSSSSGNLLGNKFNAGRSSWTREEELGRRSGRLGNGQAEHPRVQNLGGPRSISPGIA